MSSPTWSGLFKMTFLSESEFVTLNNTPEKKRRLNTEHETGLGRQQRRPA